MNYLMFFFVIQILALHVMAVARDYAAQDAALNRMGVKRVPERPYLVRHRPQRKVG